MSSVQSQQFRAAESLKQWFQPRSFPYLCYIKPETSCSEGVNPLKGRLVLGALHGLGGPAKPKIGVPGVIRDAFFSQTMTEEVLLIFSPPLACCYYTDIMVTCFKPPNVVQK